MDNTESLSPKERSRQIRNYQEKLNNLIEEDMHYEVDEQPANADKKSVSVSKWIINISYCVFGLCGIVGSFWDKFDMTKFTEFLSIFAYIWAPLVVCVAGGRSFKNFVNKKYENSTNNK